MTIFPRVLSRNFAFFLGSAVATLLTSALPAYASVTIGNNENGNCYPFNCNDSGTSSGQTIDYQEVYLGSAVGALSFNKITFYAQPSTSPDVLGGTYSISFGTTTDPLSATAPVAISNRATFANFTVSPAVPVGFSWTISGASLTPSTRRKATWSWRSWRQTRTSCRTATATAIFGLTTLASASFVVGSPLPATTGRASLRALM